MNQETARKVIRDKILELAHRLGRNASSLRDDQIIPRSGFLDSVSIMSLILWFEDHFKVSTDDEEPTLDNFGTVNLMLDYLGRHQPRG